MFGNVLRTNPTRGGKSYLRIADGNGYSESINDKKKDDPLWVGMALKVV